MNWEITGNSTIDHSVHPPELMGGEGGGGGGGILEVLEITKQGGGGVGKINILGV